MIKTSPLVFRVFLTSRILHLENTILDILLGPFVVLEESTFLHLVNMELRTVIFSKTILPLVLIAVFGLNHGVVVTSGIVVNDPIVKEHPL
jgi:hypothetical protein